MRITVVHEPWRPHPLTWIHRAEARSIVKEFRQEGSRVELVSYRNAATELPAGPILLRLSDPAMRSAVHALTLARRPFIGPKADVMERCYDKYEAYLIAMANGVDCPLTALACNADRMRYPLMLKPRRGSDSIGLRLRRSGPIPATLRNDRYIAQEFVRGAELTVGVLRDRVGMPLRILLPEGTPYSFFRKYIVRPPRAPLADAVLAERVRGFASEVAKIFGVNWAARIDLIHEATTGRLRFLECDVAPLIGIHSAFAASLESARTGRAEQLRVLIEDSRNSTT